MAMRVSCSAKIPNEPERKAVLAWVRTVANGGYSEKGDTIHLTYTEDPQDPNSHGKYWGIINYFEQFSEHEITQSEV